MTKQLIDKAKTYRLRNGGQAKVYEVYSGEGRVVHGAVFDDTIGEWFQQNWYLDGSFHPVLKNEFDLIEVKPRIKRTVYINYYKNGSFGFAHSTLYEANFISDSSAIRTACITVNLDFEEGEGL
jgi:hypothetical protein